MTAGDQLHLDEHDPDAMDDRAERLRAELDRLDLAKAAARTEALDNVRKATADVAEAETKQAAAIAEARGFGATWRDVAGAVDCTVSNAWKRWGPR
jgi:NAD(P)-dependent dehydrogenase (short-subunit alcohol dehydrogenase family)